MINHVGIRILLFCVVLSSPTASFAAFSCTITSPEPDTPYASGATIVVAGGSDWDRQNDQLPTGVRIRSYDLNGVTIVAESMSSSFNDHTGVWNGGSMAPQAGAPGLYSFTLKATLMNGFDSSPVGNEPTVTLKVRGPQGS